MTEYGSLVREEIEATIARAGFEVLDPETVRVDITDSFRRKLGECRAIAPSDREATGEYTIRIARRLFEDTGDDQWHDTVRHEVAHAYFLETVGSKVQPHGETWKDAARRAGADSVARYEGDDTVDAEYVLACPTGCFERGDLQRSKRVKNPWLYTYDERGTPPISYDITDRPADPKPGTCHVRRSRGRHRTTETARPAGVVPLDTCSPVRTAVRHGRISGARNESRPRGCTPVRSVMRRSSVATSTTSPPTSSRLCYVASIPWQEPQLIHACPNGCFSVGYGQHCR